MTFNTLPVGYNPMPHTKTFYCTEYACQNNAYYIFVYGCLDCHVRELLVCYDHGRAWIMNQRNNLLTCSQCHRYIDSFICNYAEQIKDVPIRSLHLPASHLP